MARYIDADKFIERLNASPTFPNMGTDGYFLLGVVEDLLKMQPAADVAPKSEVANEVLDEAIRTVYSKIDMKIYNTIDGKPLSDHVAYGKQMAMYDVITLLAELKKKYTEEKE